MLLLPCAAVGIRVSEGAAITGIVFLPLDTPGWPPSNELAAQVRAIRSWRTPTTRHAPIILPLAIQGSEFQRRVWAAIARIPSGATRTYGELAVELGSTARAVGQACGDNRLPLAIPCHRVVAARDMGGFAHRTDRVMLDVKRWLLAHEEPAGVCADAVTALRGRSGLAKRAARPVPGPPSTDPLIDRFIDAVWLEDGLARNSLVAYRRDLDALGAWLGKRGTSISLGGEPELAAYFAEEHASTRATTADRRLAVLRRFYRWAVREGIVALDPTLRLKGAKVPPRFPKTLTEADVEALLAAPDVTTPAGRDDRTMFEVLYAAGLRVSELVGLKEAG